MVEWQMLNTVTHILGGRTYMPKFLSSYAQKKYLFLPRITSDHERITEAEVVLVSLSDINRYTKS